MDQTASPSQKLAAALAAAAEAEAAATSEATASRLISAAEAHFLDPTNSIRAAWRKIPEGTFVFSRAAHQFSDYEKFVFKFVLILAGLGRLDRNNAEAMIASVVYAGGKSSMEGQSTASYVGDYVAVHTLVQKGNEYYVPKKLDFYANQIAQLIQANKRPNSPAAFRAWLAQHTGGVSGSTDAAKSAVFTDHNDPFALPLGVDPNTGRMAYYSGEASLLTIAPPGKGKTQCHILPALASYRGPVIALDIKGECYQETAEWRRQNVGKVICFNPVDPDHSASYSPLAFVSDEPDELWESSRFLADLLVVVRSQSDPSWENQGRDLLTLIIAFVTAVTEPSERTMSKVLDFVASIGLADMLRDVGAAESIFPSTMRRTAARFSQMATAAPKQFEGVLSGCSQHLHVWEGPKVERVTSRSDWRPEDFRSAPYPSLYLCIPPDALDTYAPILRVIVGQHVHRLMRHHGKTAAPILFLLDEMPRLGRMEPIRQALEVGRSYGIKLWMIAQYPEQLTHAYPGVGEGMMESCDVRMYMNPSSNTADRLSKAFGKSKNVLDGSQSAFVEANDIIGPAHRDSIFVLAANEKPQILRKNFYFSGKKSTGRT